jgi:hypothetical protein
MNGVSVVVVKESSDVNVQPVEPDDTDDAHVGGRIRCFAVAEALAAADSVEPREPPIVEPALKSGP